jgi:hypothetical protein
MKGRSRTRFRRISMFPNYNTVQDMWCFHAAVHRNHLLISELLYLERNASLSQRHLHSHGEELTSYDTVLGVRLDVIAFPIQGRVELKEVVYWCSILIRQLSTSVVVNRRLRSSGPLADNVTNRKFRRFC